jgi:WD40 repeat protein
MNTSIDQKENCLRLISSWKENEINSVKWSNSSKYLAAGSDDRTIRIWNINSQSLVKVINYHKDSVRSISWSPDGKKLAAGSSDKTLSIWKVASGKLIKKIDTFNDWVRSVEWSPDGKLIAAGSADQTVQIFDSESYNRIQCLRGHKDFVRCIAWSPDGTIIASSSVDSSIKLWDIKTGNPIIDLAGNDGAVITISWSPDGTMILSGSSDRTIRLWDCIMGVELQKVDAHNDSVLTVAWSPDGKNAVSGSADRTMKVWALPSLKLIKTIGGFRGSIRSAAWSQNNKYIATGSTDKILRVWEKNLKFDPIELKPYNSWVKCVDQAKISDLIVAGTDNRTIYLLNPAVGSKIWTHKGQLWVGSTAADKDERIIERKRERNEEWVRSVAWSPDETKIGYGADDRSIRVVDSITGKLIEQTSEHSDPVLFVDWNYSSTIIAASSSNVLVFWNTDTGSIIRRYDHKEGISAIKWSPTKNILAAASFDNKFILWKPIYEDKFQFFEFENKAPIISIIWSLDGLYVAGGSKERKLYIWDVNERKIIAELEGHNDMVTRLAWSSDNNLIASSSREGDIIVWEFDGINTKKFASINSEKTHYPLKLAFAEKKDYSNTNSFNELLIQQWDIENMHGDILINEGDKIDEETLHDKIQDDFNSENKAIPNKLKIFISYGKEDWPTAKKLYNKIQSYNYEPWIDRKNILPGADWDQEIKMAVESSDIVLICLSSKSSKRAGYLQKEIKYAVEIAEYKPESTIYIIPVRLDNCEIPRSLEKWQWLDIFDENKFEKLLTTFETIGNKVYK